jgi:integrase
MATKLTDMKVEKLRAKSQPYFEWDNQATGLALKVLPTGKKVWILQAVLPGQRFQSKLSLGEYSSGMTLATARAKAQLWRGLIQAGRHPREVEAAQHEEQRRADEAARVAKAKAVANSFTAVAERYIAARVNQQRRARRSAQEIRLLLVSAFDKPITDITPDDVKVAISRIASRAPWQAKQALTHLTTLFKWAVFHGDVPVSPVASLPAAMLLDGVKLEPRQRWLSDPELFAFWRAVGRLKYPARQLYQMLALTACRLHEVLRARWSEFSPELRAAFQQGRPLTALPPTAKLWTIPAARYKTGSDHVVPLTDAALEVLATLPRHRRGDALFSTNGHAPHVNQSEWKVRIDRRMLRSLRALARQRGEDPRYVKLPDWVNHDLRRTARTGLAALKVPSVVAELALGHAREGIEGVYDKFEYLNEIRDAMTQWAERLRKITTPAPTPSPDNVVRLQRRRS